MRPLLVNSKFFWLFCDAISGNEPHVISSELARSFRFGKSSPKRDFFSYTLPGISVNNFILDSNSIDKKQQNVLATSKSFFCFSGSCYNIPELKNRYRFSDHSGSDLENPLEFLRELILQVGPEILSELNGIFCMAYQEPNSGKIIIANDRYGFFPLYYCLQDKSLLVASECKSIASYTNDFDFDPGGIGDFFYIGHMVGDRTLFKSIKSLGPGQYIEWDHGQCHIRTYWHLNDLPIIDQSDIDISHLHDLFEKSVSMRISSNNESLLLSGGFDSRLIFGALLHQGCKPDLITLENSALKHGLEGSIAKNLANIFDANIRVYQTRRGYYNSSQALDVFFILDGMIPSFDLFITQVYPEIQDNSVNVWDGLALDNALGGHNIFGESVNLNLRNYLSAYKIKRPFLKAILDENYFSLVEESFISGLNREVSKYFGKPNGWLKFMLSNRSRRRLAVNPFQLYSRKANAKTPGADSEFLDYMLSIPDNFRKYRRLYIRLFMHSYKDLMSVPVLSAGHYFEFFNKNGAANHEMIIGKDTIKKIVKMSGLGYHAKSLLAMMKGINQDMRAMPSNDLLVKLFNYKNFNRSIYDKKRINKLLNMASKNSLYAQNYLQIMFYLELWHNIFNESSLDFLHSDVFQPSTASC